jgi:phosphoserine phosphatase
MSTRANWPTPQVNERGGLLYLARHSLTQWNLEGRLQGRADIPLCPEGIRKARDLASRLPGLGIAVVVASTAARAWETGSIYAKHLRVPLEPSPGLMELHHGEWEGRTFDDLVKDQRSMYCEWLRNPATVKIPGGTETVRHAQQRVVRAVASAAKAHGSKRVLLVTHKHIRCLLLCYLLSRPLSAFSSLLSDSLAPEPLPATNWLARALGDSAT